ncbi:probable G-protein coupled receptor 139 [Anoplophora glabripennis]|uniref:probable G-protein coupled receptor 139 n=1 Tax=Anoplophora glabripennis TaxID=217634 RepID=UPI00087581E4|nr:probable G-protein coupled receptor 139 [Anoplophora glabripennis]
MITINNATAFKLYVRKLLRNATFNVSDAEIKRIMDYNNITDEADAPSESSCGGANLENLVATYAEYYHPYLSISVCVFGTVANILNIVVLTRKDMVSAPINRILTALAVADMLLMIEYIPFAYYYHLELLGKRDFPYYGAVFMLMHTHVTQILHTISVCLTLTLAVWRYLAIGYPEKNHILCSDRRCTFAITVCYILPILLCFPSYSMFEITTTEITENGQNYTLYHTTLRENVKRDKTLLKINFWMFAVFIKLLPCIILTIISCWLIRTLFKAKKRKQVLRGYDSYPLTTNGKDAKRKVSKAERRADRTTKMLIAVLLLFLLTEFPQGIFAFFIGLKGKDLFLVCYQQYGEIMDIMALLNGSINFILYCCMNRMFRATFGQLFKHKILAKWANAPPSEIHTTTLPNGTNTTTL